MPPLQSIISTSADHGTSVSECFQESVRWILMVKGPPKALWAPRTSPEARSAGFPWVSALMGLSGPSPSPRAGLEFPHCNKYKGACL